MPAHDPSDTDTERGTFETDLRDRDPKALDELAQRYLGRVHGLVRSEVRDEELAADLTQDVFVRLIGAIDRYDPERSLDPWVTTIARNRIRDFWRSHVRRERGADGGREEGEDLLAALPDEGPAPGGELEEAESSQVLRRAVAGLPAALRQAVELRVFDGLSFEAAGRVAGRTAIAMRKRYSRALEALREAAERSGLEVEVLTAA